MSAFSSLALAIGSPIEFVLLKRFKLAVAVAAIDSELAVARLVRSSLDPDASSHLLLLKDIVVCPGDDQFAFHKTALAFEDCSAGTLDSFLQHSASLSSADVIDCARQLVSGLEDMSKCKLWHRDLTTTNVFVHRTDGGLVFKIGEYGLDQQPLGLRGEPDVRSLGHVLSALMNDDAAGVELGFPSHYPKALLGLVSEMLSPDPSKRPTLRAVRLALERLFDKQPDSSGATGRRMPSWLPYCCS